MSSVQEKNGTNNGANAIGKVPAVELSQKWARWWSACRILWGTAFVLAILSLVAVVAISRRSGKQLQQASQAVIHTREVIEKLGNITARLSEVESAARSFAISGKQSHLSPFYTAAKAVPPQMDELELLVQDDPGQLQSITKIAPVIARHLKVMKDMVELGDKNLFRGFSQRSLTDEGNGLMEQIRAAFKAMDEVTPAVVAIAFGLSAVFIPVAFVSGITGQFYRQFALTIAISTIISAFNSLSLSPALSAEEEITA